MSAQLYKRRWQTELFFHWITKNLVLRRMLTKNPNAVRLQVFTALIAPLAFTLLRQVSRSGMPLKRIRLQALRDDRLAPAQCLGTTRPAR